MLWQYVIATIKYLFCFSSPDNVGQVALPFPGYN